MGGEERRVIGQGGGKQVGVKKRKEGREGEMEEGVSRIMYKGIGGWVGGGGCWGCWGRRNG